VIKDVLQKVQVLLHKLKRRTGCGRGGDGVKR
jgi:hypothetical protein